MTKKNSNATTILLFLHKLCEVLLSLSLKAVQQSLMARYDQVFTEYFKELEEESIRDNFVIIYELLDEMMDFGYPQTTESKILQESVKNEFIVIHLA
jgi:AP-1 complex subunit mu